MIVYRVTGSAEQWAGAGKLAIDPVTAPTKAAILKQLRNTAATLNMADLSYDLRAEKLLVGNDKTALNRLFETGDPDEIVLEAEVLKTLTKEIDRA